MKKTFLASTLLRLLSAAALASLPLAGQAQQQPQQQPSPGAATRYDRLSPEEKLLRQVPYFAQNNQPVADVFQSLARAHGITIICDKDVEGTVNFECHNLSLSGIIDAICDSTGLYWEIKEQGYIWVCRYRTYLYKVEYPQLEREVDTSSKVRFGNASSSSGFNMQGSGSGSGGGSSGSGGGSSGGNTEDETTVQLKSKAKAEFWDSLQKELDAFKQKDEKITISRIVGQINVYASRRTHEHLTQYISRLNGRVAQQVEILAKIVEVTMDDQNKFGVDWNLVRTATWGDLIFGPSRVDAVTGTRTAPVFGTSTNITGFSGGQELGSDAFVGTIGLGKVEAVIRALSQQGNVNTVTAPRLVTANNQTAYIKDTEDRPFFQLMNSTTQTSVNTGTTLTDSKNYQIQTFSIGTIVSVTPHVSDNGDIALDIIPALTRLRAVMESPSGDSNAPALYVRQMSTIARLRSGETAIVGGIITDTEATQTRGVPLLKDIPWVGALFRTDAKITQKTELVIFLTPRILTPGDSLSTEGLREAARSSFEVRAGSRRDAPLPPDDSSLGGGVETFSIL